MINKRMDSTVSFSPNLFPSPTILKKMDFFADQDGILNRYINEEGGWEPHLKNSKTFIKECLKNQNAKRVSILGSGWLLDVPVNFLAENCEEVIFYDIRHPAEIINRYRKQLNFKFVVMDITGGLINQVYILLNSRKKIDFNEIEQLIVIPSVELPFQSDFIVSLNLINQLDILIIDYIKTKINLPDNFANKLRSGIQQKHLELMQLGKSCLITDFEEVNLDKEDNIIQKKALLYTPVREGLIQKRWIWEFDSKMTYQKNLKTNFNVMALIF
jgi:hypothetical protein